jgi:hypothetical protein
MDTWDSLISKPDHEILSHKTSSILYFPSDVRRFKLLPCIYDFQSGLDKLRQNPGFYISEKSLNTCLHGPVGSFSLAEVLLCFMSGPLGLSTAITPFRGNSADA